MGNRCVPSKRTGNPINPGPPTVTPTTVTPPICNLAPEIIVEILQFLSPLDLGHLRRTCHALKHISNLAWRAMFLNEFPNHNREWLLPPYTEAEWWYQTYRAHKQNKRVVNNHQLVIPTRNDVPIWNIDYSPRHKLLLTVSQKGLELWQLPGTYINPLLHEMELENKKWELVGRKGACKYIFSPQVCLGPNGMVYAIMRDDKRGAIARVQRDKDLPSLLCPEGEYFIQLQLHPISETLVAAISSSGQGGHLLVWDNDNQKSYHFEEIPSAMCADWETIFVATTQMIHKYSWTTGTHTTIQLNFHVSGMCLLTEKQVLAVQSNDNNNVGATTEITRTLILCSTPSGSSCVMLQPTTGEGEHPMLNTVMQQQNGHQRVRNLMLRDMDFCAYEAIVSTDEHQVISITAPWVKEVKNTQTSLISSIPEVSKCSLIQTRTNSNVSYDTVRVRHFARFAIFCSPDGVFVSLKA